MGRITKFSIQFRHKHIADVRITSNKAFLGGPLGRVEKSQRFAALDITPPLHRHTTPLYDSSAHPKPSFSRLARTPDSRSGLLALYTMNPNWLLAIPAVSICGR